MQSSWKEIKTLKTLQNQVKLKVKLTNRLEPQGTHLFLLKT